jgi:hypothetical protein
MAPLISWFKADNTTPFASWEVGQHDTGTVTADETVLIWNNKAGGVTISDAENCIVTTKDLSGGNTGDVVVDTWVETKCVAAGNTSFIPIGGLSTNSIRAAGASAGSGVIKGTSNVGSLTDTDNYAQILLHLNIPVTGNPGTYSLLLRLGYSFV